jgi:polysaccharide deacetylase 2 family uncharacterized protein YibQ
MADDLGAPLSRRSTRKQAAAGLMAARRLPIARLSFVAIGLIIAVVVAAILFVRDPDGGRPVAEVPVATTIDANTVAAANSIPLQNSASITAIGDEFPAGHGPSITVLDDLPGTPAGGTATPTGALADLLEETPDGAIPRVGPGGQTPFATYAGSVDPTAASGPQVAIVMTGMGLNETGTYDAIDRLPPAVTFAFAPYGKALEQTAAAARAGGHELMLQVPLEPFDYPQNDPGPQTLLTGVPPRANLDKLFWLLGRFGGYVGLVNYMGSRFSASATDMQPVMEELATRGLGYIDDGASPRSVAGQLASSVKLPFARAALTLDVNPSREAILAALEQLVATARRSGSAVGVISGLPVSIDTIAEWASGVAGVTLVPASALMKT